jgi:Protein of unknown function (DUF1064)
MPRRPFLSSHKPDKRRVRGAESTTVDGIKFPSKREAKRWSELRLLERAGQITELERQVKYELRAPRGMNTEVIGHYIADFRYYRRVTTKNTSLEVMVVEDAKGWRTDLYQWKIRHLRAQYGIVVEEV